ncbi:ABC transporter ATP-binding protein [Filomicrobium sp.]|uniref:ABC transporter ATP-binding protein n=1 Tax=Filomicrobium sp. TaxID=2024831 RepID=UPI0025829C5B|nr:ABC transporter ATP-binding protein [Filomicrobium sp.]MCV0370325.1 ABC transporter ATP-binding protein [Filomicrobium sp.]
MSRLSLDNVTVTLGDRKVLDRVSLNMEGGEFVGLLGPNGAGKSTLLRTITQEIPYEGRITLDGKPLADLGAEGRARSLAYLPQIRDIAWPVSVTEIVALGRLPHCRPFAKMTMADGAIVADAMERMDITALAHRRATELSGGEMARVLMARVLAQETPIIIADEPAAGLDPAHQIALVETFAAIAKSGRTVIASLHELPLAARWCQRIILISQGKIVADGPASKVVTTENLSRVYGVEAMLMEDAQGLIVAPIRLTPRTS